MGTENSPPKKTMRELMPPNYLPILEKRTGLKRQAVYRAVKKENHKSKAWPMIVQLAKEHEQQQQDEQILMTGS